MKTITKLLLLALLILNCSYQQSTTAPESVLDTPENHYVQGLRELESQDMEAAIELFQRALELDADYALAYVGCARVELERRNYSEVYKYVQTALNKDENCKEAYIVRGRAITQEKEKDNWLEEAKKNFIKVLEKKPNDEEALFYLATAYKEAGMYTDAGNQ